MDVLALFHPSAHDARADWLTRQQLPAPVPSPGPGPGLIEHNRIVIELPAS